MTARSKRRRDVNFLVGKRQRDLGRLLVAAVALAAAACGPGNGAPQVELYKLGLITTIAFMAVYLLIGTPWIPFAASP